jgi:pyruvate kinase
MTAALSAQPDAMLLAEETSVGSNPVQSVRKLEELIRQEESSDRRETPVAVALATEQDQTVAAAMKQADEVKAEGIVVFTRLGNSASLCAALRPRQSRVFAFTPDARLARRLCLRYAVEPVVLSFSEQPKKTIRAAEKALLEGKFLASGAMVVFITDILDQGQRISSVQLRTLVET